jgi:ankyrin repeat protein
MNHTLPKAVGPTAVATRGQEMLAREAPSAIHRSPTPLISIDIGMSDNLNAIKVLLENKAALSEEEILVLVRPKLESDPRVVLEQGFYGKTLLQYAAMFSTPELCRVLIEFDPTRESLQMADVPGYLPIHWACDQCHLEIFKYLLELRPESINALTNGGENCLHSLLIGALDHDDATCDQVIEFAQFILSLCPEFISATTDDDELPLHIVCNVGQLGNAFLLQNFCTTKTPMPYIWQTRLGVLLWVLYS